MGKSTQEILQNHVQRVADTLTHGFEEGCLNDDGGTMTAHDYVHEALDINYVTDKKHDYIGARILIACGGPNIWIDTRNIKVEGFWGGDYACAYYADGIGIDDAAADLFNSCA